MPRPQGSSRRASQPAAIEPTKSRRTQKATSRSPRAEVAALDVSVLRSVQIVVPESNDSTTDYRLFRVHSGWLHKQSSDGVDFATAARLSVANVYIEFRNDDFTLQFESIEILTELEEKNSLWYYRASFNRRRSIVDRYEFD